MVTRRGFFAGTLATASIAAGARLPDGGSPSGSRHSVVVVGGGPAGVCAAVAAARHGADVLVVEQGNCLGGMGTQRSIRRTSAPERPSPHGTGAVTITARRSSRRR